MKRVTICLLLLSLVVFSCKRKKRDMLIGTWHAVKLENPDMDSFFINSQAYIDTVGKGHDAATNMQLYGVANMDSMRIILQRQYDSTKALQMNSVTNTVFKFRKDSVVILSFNGAVDSSKWYFDSDGALILDQLNSGGGDKARLEIMALSDTALKLKFQENGSNSIVTFHPETPNP